MAIHMPLSTSALKDLFVRLEEVDQSYRQEICQCDYSDTCNFVCSYLLNDKKGVSTLFPMTVSVFALLSAFVFPCAVFIMNAHQLAQFAALVLTRV